MPYKSDAQRAYMHIHHPEIAKKWDKKYPKSAHSKSLPEHKEASMNKLAQAISSLPISKQVALENALQKQASERLHTKLSEYLNKEAGSLANSAVSLAGSATSLANPLAGLAIQYGVPALAEWGFNKFINPTTSTQQPQQPQAPQQTPTPAQSGWQTPHEIGKFKPYMPSYNSYKKPMSYFTGV